MLKLVTKDKKVTVCMNDWMEAVDYLFSLDDSHKESVQKVNHKRFIKLFKQFCEENIHVKHRDNGKEFFVIEYFSDNPPILKV